MPNVGSITWRLVGAPVTLENGGLPTYTVSYTGDPISEPVTIQLDPIFPGGLGGANPEGIGGVNPSDYVGTFSAALAAAIGLLPPGAGVSFDASTYQLTFSPGGATSLTFSLPIGQDAEAEGREHYLVRIQNPSFGMVETVSDGMLAGHVVLTGIVDDDGFAAGERAWSITGDYAAVEGQAPKFTVTLAGDPLPAGVTASVELFPVFQSGLNLASSADFANAFAADVQAAIAALPPGSGISFDSATGRLTFTGGGLARLEFGLPTVADGAFEGDEIYLVNLANPSAGSQIASSAESVFSIIVDREAVSDGVEWLIAGSQLVAEGGVPTYTVKWKGPDLDAPLSIELGIVLPGVVGAASAADFLAAFASDVAAAIAAQAPGTTITFDAATQRLTWFPSVPPPPKDFTFTLPTLNDALAEGIEAYAITLSNPSSGRIIETLGGITTRIADDDPPPTVAIADAQATEGQPLVFDVTLSNPSAAAIQLELSAANGTAEGGPDFETASFETSSDGGATWLAAGGPSGRVVTFQAGTTALKVRIDTADDAIDEGAETMTLSVASVVSGTVGDTTDTGTGTILDNDAAPSVAIGDAQATEGQPLVFDVTLSNPSAGPITLALVAANGTAEGGLDFETTSFEVSSDGGATWSPAGGASGREVTFAAGATALKVRVDTAEDTVAEGTETMTLAVAAVVAGAVGSAAGVGTGTILDNDAAPSVAIGDAQATEGQPLVFDVTLSNPSAGPITLALAAANGSAEGGLDFETTSFEVSSDGGASWAPAGGLDGRALTFAAGATALKVRIDTADDALAEGTETMSLGVAAVVSGTVGDTSDVGTGTIADNDAAPNVVIGDAQTTEGQPLVFDVTLAGASAAPITLELAAANGSAEGGVDFETAGFEVSTDGGSTWTAAGGASGREVTFPAGATSLKVRIDTADDALVEGSETMALTISAVVAGTVGDIADVGTGTIADNDVGQHELKINEIGLGIATAPSGDDGQSFVEIRNVGGGAASAGDLSSYRLEIAGPCGSKTFVKFGSFHPAATLPAGAFLVVYENGEYKTVGADGVTLATGSWGDDGDGWSLGASVADAIGVNLFVKGGESVDAFFANGADRHGFHGNPQFEGVDAAGTIKLAHRAGADHALFDNGDFNGLLGDMRAALDALGLGGRATRLLAEGAEPLTVFARVFGPADGTPADTNSVADWTIAGIPTDGRFNAQPGDIAAADAGDLDPRQNDGVNAAIAGQTVLYAKDAGPLLEGGRGPDFLYGDDRDNVVLAGDHRDLAFGGRGNDQLYGGFGADLLIDFAGRDVLAGEAGNDALVAAPDTGHGRGASSAGADLLIGDSIVPLGSTPPPSGSDAITAGDQGDLVFGDNLVLDAATQAAFDARLPADQLQALVRAKVVDAGDPAYDAALRDAQHADGADDRIDAGAGDDVVFGQGGNDDINGGDGNDILFGGAGSDVLRGGSGMDVIHADPREDTVLGGAGKDTLALTMSGTLDLAGLAGSSIRSIEQIDMRGGGDLELRMNVDDLLAMSGSGRVTVLGGAGDKLTFDASGHSVDTFASGGFIVHVIDNGAAVLKLDASLSQSVVGI